MPLIHKNIDILRDKLSRSDLPCSNKRIGIKKTLMFAIEPIQYNKNIKILRPNQLTQWLARRQTLDQTSSSDTSDDEASSLTGFQAECGPQLSPVAILESSPEPEPAPAPKPIPVPKPVPVSVPAPKPAPAPKPVPAPKPAPAPKPVPAPKQIPDPKPKPAPVLEPDAEPQLDKESQRNSQNSAESSQTSTSAVWECEVDALIINEKIDDEFANISDEDINETEIAKNRKKIRVDVPLNNSNSSVKHNNNILKEKSNSRPRDTPREQVNHNLPKEKTNIVTEDKTNNVHKDKDDSPPIPLAPPTVQPQRVTEPNWPETTKHLLNNEFNLVFKELIHFKDKVKRDDTARQLLKNTVIRCIQEDETSQLIDFLTLVYEVQITDDPDFWSELVLRLKRKLNSHSTLKSYKSKANPEWIFNNYKNAISSIGRHAKELDLTIKLPFNTLIWLIDLSRPTQPTAPNPEVASNPTVLIKQEESSLAGAKFNVKFMQLKKEIKDEPDTHEKSTTGENTTTSNAIPPPTNNNCSTKSVDLPQRCIVNNNGTTLTPASSKSLPVTNASTTTEATTSIHDKSRKVQAETNERGRMKFTITAKRRPRRTKQ